MSSSDIIIVDGYQFSKAGIRAFKSKESLAKAHSHIKLLKGVDFDRLFEIANKIEDAKHDKIKKSSKGTKDD